MRSLAVRTREKIRDDGVRAFLWTAVSFIRGELNAKIRRPIENVYWDRYDVQNIRLNGSQATFKSRSDQQGDRIRFTVKRENPIIADFIEELDSDDSFIDIGANLGVYTCFAQNIVDEGDIVAIEPDRSNQQILAANVSLNGGSSVNIIQKAAGDEPGTLYFNPATESVDPGSEGYEVPSQPIDELVGNKKEYFPTVAKIDVEGYERQVLEGMSETLSDDRCRLVYCEVHEPATHRPSAESYGGSHTDIQSILQNHGFKAELIERTGKEIHIKATK